MRMKWLAMAACAVLSHCHAVAGEIGDAPMPLTSRVASPTSDVIAMFESAGMRDVHAHVLTVGERARVDAALAALPTLHLALLSKKLRHLSFVDGIPGEGSGLTAKVGETGQFDITLRTSLLDESLSAFLTAKELRLFEADASGNSVTVDAAGADALTYVLLHEATHVVDVALGISTKLDGPFEKGIWLDRTRLVPEFADSPAATTIFRGGRPIPAGQATIVYDGLARTPFVSLYATAAAAEDLAELVAWHQVSRRHDSSLTITAFDAAGMPLKRYEPLNFPAVKARMAQVDALLTQPGSS